MWVVILTGGDCRCFIFLRHPGLDPGSSLMSKPVYTFKEAGSRIKSGMTMKESVRCRSNPDGNLTYPCGLIRYFSPVRFAL